MVNPSSRRRPLILAAIIFAALSLAAAQIGAQSAAGAPAAGAVIATPAAPAGRPLPEGTDRRFIADLYGLRDAVYESASPASVEREALRLIHDVKTQRLGEADEYLVLSRIEYLAGRSWNEGGDKKRAATHFEAAVEYAKLSMKKGEDPAGLQALTKPLSELCLIKDMAFLVLNGPKISQNARKILAIEPGQPGATITLASAKAYPPPIFGGNPREAIEQLVALIALHPEGFEKDELFDIRACLGTACAKLKRNADARFWFAAALELYPSNNYARGELGKVTP